jgi:myo-inositol-1(or 4)-monophosphatase
MMHEKIDLLKKVEPVIKEAGSILLSHFKKPIKWHEKKDAGLVTQADLESEKFLIQKLGEIFPEASFFTEEEGKKGDENAPYCWVIDPLDGTTNYAHGLPYFCISVGLTYQKKPIWGAVYQPILDEFFYAQKGKGAFLNGKKIQANAKTPFNKSFIAIGVPYAKDSKFNEIIHTLDAIAPKTFGFRHMGAAALDQVYVACGRFDGVVFENLEWWDVAAGIIILEESGALVTDFSNKPVNQNYISFIAAAAPLHEQLLKVIQEVIK